MNSERTDFEEEMKGGPGWGFPLPYGLPLNTMDRSGVRAE